MPQLNDPSNFPGGPVAKNLPANAGDTEDMGSIPGSGRPPGEGNGNSLQYSSLGNPMDRGAWQAIGHGVARVRHNLATKQQQNVNHNVDLRSIQHRATITMA